MSPKFILSIAVVALVYSRASGQLYIGFQDLPSFDGYFEKIGWGQQPGPLWGSLQQTRWDPGFSSPITYSGGANFVNENNHGISGSVSVQSGKGGEGMVRADFPIVNNPVHKVDGFGQIDRNLNKNLNPIGAEKTTFGATYKNSDNLATAKFEQSQVHGNLAIKTISGSIPVVNTDSHLLTLSGKDTLGQQQTVGLSYQNKDSGATASLTGKQNVGNPARGTASVSIPIVDQKGIQVNLEGQSTFGHGMKPDSKVGVNVNIPL